MLHTGLSHPQSDRLMAKLMVDDIRRPVEDSHRFCSACLTLTKPFVDDHLPGKLCATLAQDPYEDRERGRFKKLLCNESRVTCPSFTFPKVSLSSLASREVWN